jgi:chromosome segregation ATPase
MSDYKQTRDAAGKVTKQYDKMLRSLGDDDLVKDWDEYVESMGSVMGEVEHMAQQMRDRIEELEAAFNNLHREYNSRGDRIAELEKRLAKAVEALGDALSLVPDDEGPEIDFIRTTLAELKPKP